MLNQEPTQLPVAAASRGAHSAASGHPCVTTPTRHPNGPLLASGAAAIVVSLFIVFGLNRLASAEPDAYRAQLRLRTGGAIDGIVLDYDNDGVVIEHDSTPYVFAWTELEGANAFATRGRLLIRERGGYDVFSADDHFDMGVFALRQERRDAAAIEFRRCKAIEPSYAKKIGKTVKAMDRARKRVGLDAADKPKRRKPTSRRGSPSAPKSGAPQPSSRDGAEPPSSKPPSVATGTRSLPADRVEQAYRTFGAKVQEVLGKRVVLVESPHFLIWTDWKKAHRKRLGLWAEAMFAALCRQFNIKDSDAIFPARCPMFCFRSKAKFQQFAQHFDGYDGANSIGYTRSIEENGHVHVAALRQGASNIDFDRFAWTLVHEGSHAFVHRLYSSRFIPHWINEGLAELTSERVLGDRCPAGEIAALLAKQIVRRHLPITKLLASVDPIGVHQYPIAQSVVTYLEGQGPDRFAGMIADLKAGKTVPESLAARYEGMTLEQLEVRWRAWVRSTMTATGTEAPTASGVPQASP